MNQLVLDLKAKRSALRAEANRHIRRAESESRGMTPAESRACDTALADLSTISDRIDQLDETEIRDDLAAKHRKEINATSSITTRGRDVYAADNFTHSFFADQRAAQFGDQAASQRLAQNNVDREFRAGDLASNVAGAGSSFAPPGWLIDSFVELARPGRVTADLMHKEPLPQGVSSINLPKISGGTAAGIQITQNSALTDTAMTTTSVSSGISTIGGKQIVALQLLQQSPGASFDRIVLGDLAADFAKSLNAQVISGTGTNGQLRGIASVTGNTAVAYTTASPAVVSTTSANSFYNAIVKAVSTVAQNRFAPAQAIVMRPDRWGWLLEALDGSSRPLVTPNGASFNGLAVSGAPTAGGAAGTLMGLPVFIDPMIPTTWGSTTNQDAVLVLRTDDMWLYESELQLEVFSATYADQNSILCRALGYASFIPDRQPASVGVISGTGCVQAQL